jgi:hypothetical protein
LVVHVVLAFAPALNLPDAQAKHWLLAPALFTLRYLPAKHDVILVEHVVPAFVPVLNLPDAQALHLLSLVAGVAWYE